ncbi:MFS transporter [Ferrimonas kyonanensis]|uniref:MFS transporter n=1 Tax=Ferrimonas kyonanensis TaxID=364763 RepID=UPI00041E6287|nr:MFS transporter [Ferrimonas kyonanensis]
MSPNQLAKWALIAVTAFAVISDSMLLPFYPIYFEVMFHSSDPLLTSRYLAVSCLIVIVALPLWARVARRFGTLKVLMLSQVGALLASVGCANAPTLAVLFASGWIMVLFKASYLLVYPYLLTLEEAKHQPHTVGLLSVIVHLGAIIGALVGGSILQLAHPPQAFLWMAVGDGLQILVCGWLLLRVQPQSLVANRQQPCEDTTAAARRATTRPKVQLALIMWLFYFSAYLIRPFFVQYWHRLSPQSGEIEAAVIFAIPAAIAIAALMLQRHSRQPRWLQTLGQIPVALAIGAVGFALQAQPQPHWIIVGRVLYGWALFHATVKLDLKIFALSHPNEYSKDFATLHIFQSLGVLVASYAAGQLMVAGGDQLLFVCASGGFILTTLLFWQWFMPREKRLKGATL